MTEVKSDHSDSPPNLFGRRAAYFAVLLASPVFLLFIYLDKIRQGFGAWICAGLIVGVVRIYWDLRKHLWFWMAILMAVFLQIPFVMFVPWTKYHPAVVFMLPYGFLDFFLIEWLIKQAEKIAARRLSSPSI
jgi:hypothetical protein